MPYTPTILYKLEKASGCSSPSRGELEPVSFASSTKTCRGISPACGEGLKALGKKFI